MRRPPSLIVNLKRYSSCACQAENISTSPNAAPASINAGEVAPRSSAAVPTTSMTLATIAMTNTDPPTRNHRSTPAPPRARMMRESARASTSRVNPSLIRAAAQPTMVTGNRRPVYRTRGGALLPRLRRRHVSPTPMPKVPMSSVSAPMARRWGAGIQPSRRSTEGV